MKLAILLSVGFFLCWVDGRRCFAESQTVYQYTDDSGTVVFVEDPADIPPEKRPKAGSIKMRNDPAATEQAKPAARQTPLEKPRDKAKAGAGRRPEITLYMTSWCGYCRKMKSRLDDSGFAYAEKDIEKDSEANRAFRRYGGTGVPLLVIDGSVIRGYNPAQVERTLEKYR